MTRTARLELPDDLVQRSWPAAAKARRLKGSAIVRCSALKTGQLDICVVEQEAPLGEGFGEAALALVRGAKVQPASINGQLSDSIVRAHIRFGYDEELRLRASVAPIHTDIDWVAAPDVKTLAAALPLAGRRLGGNGVVRLGCTAGPGGELTDCSIISEAPSAEYGYGKAALKLVDRFRVAPQTRAGQPTAGVRISFLVRFPASLANKRIVGVSVHRTGQPMTEDITHAGDNARAAGAPSAATVVLSCKVGRVGKVENCTGRSDAPGAKAFIDAGLALAPPYEFSLWDDGLPAQGVSVELPLDFNDRKTTNQP